MRTKLGTSWGQVAAVLVGLLGLAGSARAQTPNPNYWRASVQVLFQGVSSPGQLTDSDPPALVYGLAMKTCVKTYHNTATALLASDTGCRIMYLSMSDIDALIGRLQEYRSNPAAHQGDPGYIFARVEDTGTVPIEAIPAPTSTHHP